MAVGADKSLPRERPPVPRPNALAPSAGVPSAGPPAPRVSDRAVQAMQNNQAAASAGARETTLQDMDRAGVSRGRGQQYYADMSQAIADEDGRAAAAQTAQGAEFANRAARSAFDDTIANERLANAGLLEGLRANTMRERAARAGWQQNLYEAIRNGQFQLDSMQLDYSPLMAGLFR
jgi:type IV secretory pathway VirB10-like protein